MIIETQLTFKQYFNFRLRRLYRSPFIIIITIIIGGSIAEALLSSPINIKDLFINLFSGFVVTGIFIFRIYSSARAHFYSNTKLQGKIIYEFTESKISITGEGFKSEFDWEGIYKIKELKNLVLIYQSKVSANIIPKKDFGDKIDDFRQLMKSKIAM